MKQWAAEVIAAPRKKPLPILSFPAVQIMGVSVRELILSSALQSRAMELVAARTNSAASVSFMDLSVEAECFGAAVHITDDEVPTVVGSIVSSQAEAEALRVPAIGSGRTGVCLESIRRAAARIEDRPVFAGVIGPFSLAGRLTNVNEIMFFCYDEPDLVHILMKKCTDFLIDYCFAYKAAGAGGVVIAEPLAGILSPSLSDEFSHPYTKRIIDAVQDDGFAVVYHNCGNSVLSMADSVFSLGAAAYHFGDAVDIFKMLEKAPAESLVMGNISPAIQFRAGTAASVRAATLSVMETCCAYPNFVISSGCDIPPKTPWKNIDSFFAAVNEFYDGRGPRG